MEPSGVVLGGKIAAENKPYDDLLFSDHVLGPPGPPWRIFEALGASCEWFLKPSGALLGYSTMVLEIFHENLFKLPPKVFLQSTGCRFPKRLGDSLGMKVILIYSILQSVPDT